MRVKPAMTRAHFNTPPFMLISSIRRVGNHHLSTAPRFYLFGGNYPGVSPIGSTPGYVPTTPTAFHFSWPFRQFS